MTIPRKNIYLISAVSTVILICIIFGFYFFSQNSLGNSKSQSQNSSLDQTSQNKIPLLSVASERAKQRGGNEVDGVFITSNSQFSNSNSNSNSSEISAFSDNFTNSNSNNSTTISQNSIQSQTQTLPNNSPNSQIYTNPNYPKLAIKYDPSWKISSGMLDNTNNGQTENIVFTKNNSKLIFSFKILSGFGCSSTEITKPVLGVGTKFRYKLGNNKFIYNSGSESKNDCLAFVDQKITTSFAKDQFPIAENDGKNVFAWVLASLDSGSLDEIAEADQIIKNSILE